MRDGHDFYSDSREKQRKTAFLDPIKSPQRRILSDI